MYNILAMFVRDFEMEYFVENWKMMWYYEYYDSVKILLSNIR